MEFITVAKLQMSDFTRFESSNIVCLIFYIHVPGKHKPTCATKKNLKFALREMLKWQTVLRYLTSVVPFILTINVTLHHAAVSFFLCIKCYHVSTELDMM